MPPDTLPELNDGYTVEIITELNLQAAWDYKRDLGNGLCV